MEVLLSILLGVGLSAATGMRIFVPALVASLATQQGIISPGEGFLWMGTWPAIIAFGVATVVEIGAFYIPWVDNALDTVAGPGAIVAGGLIATSFIDIDSEALRWMLGMIAGGSTAGLVQTGTALLRAGSTATTGGLGNPVVSTGEAIGAFSLSALSILAAPIAIVVLLILLVLGYRRIRSWRRGRARASYPSAKAPSVPNGPSVD